MLYRATGRRLLIQITRSTCLAAAAPQTNLMFNSACVAEVHTPAKPVCGHVAGTVVLQTDLELLSADNDTVMP